MPLQTNKFNNIFHFFNSIQNLHLFDLPRPTQAKNMLAQALAIGAIMNRGESNRPISPAAINNSVALASTLSKSPLFAAAIQLLVRQGNF